MRGAAEAAMTQTWGRTDTAGTWPHPKPVWTMAALLVALAERGAIDGVSVRRDVDAAPALVRLARTSGAR